MTVEPAVLAPGATSGTANLLLTVVREKIEEAPWKYRIVARTRRQCIAIHVTDRDEHVRVEGGSGQWVIRNGHGERADITISMPQRALPMVLDIPEGPVRLPALWRGNGLTVTRAILGRRLRVRGLIRHLLMAVRFLQVLSVPADR
jgi:hypothetical protein